MLNEKEGLYYLQPSLFLKDKSVVAGFSARLGGVSKGNYYSLNLASHTGDHLYRVMENRRRFLSLWNLSARQVVSGNQVHGTAVHLVKDNNCPGDSEAGTVIPECDALVSNLDNVALAAFSADCLIIFLYESEKKVVSLVHAGWRGVLQGITGKVTDILKKEYGCNNQKIIAAVSPGICFKCFAVGADVAARFAEEGWDDPAYLVKGSAGKFFINLPGIVRRQLSDGGINDKDIDMSGLCTACLPGYFYSYRRDGEKTGRMMAVIGKIS